jgi:DNA-binding MarR family transcriptional regulator
MRSVNAGELHRLARVLMDIAVAATANPGERPVPASTIAIVVDVRQHPSSSISQIVERTGLAQSLVSGTVARLGDAGVFIVEQDAKDRRRVLVKMDPRRQVEDFTERGARSIAGAIREVVPDATDARVARIDSALDRLAKDLLRR